jgi:broad specificity phosphatase PhoE
MQAILTTRDGSPDRLALMDTGHKRSSTVVVVSHGDALSALAAGGA